ncbi:interleukin 2 receptor, gamma b [Alosa pseudoharengus]|uniref:interleukin 2 receptor, gamma b n=1 Tax=Alosa pseudoharengus TaxID=34774 RepID=UPI003F8A71F6
MIPSKSFLVLFGGLIVCCVMGRCLTSIPSVDCYIVNLENVNCTWNCDSDVSFSFSYWTPDGVPSSRKYTECPTYQFKDGCSVGCIFPFHQGNRFKHLHTSLFHGATQKNQTHDMRIDVKLHPPQNLTVLWNNTTGDVSLWWNISGPVKDTCVESMISYRMDSGTWQDLKELLPASTSYTFAKVSRTKSYMFRARSRYASHCKQFKYWSDWTAAVQWGPVEPSNSADISVKKGLYVAFGVVALAIILIIMVRVLLECERIRVIFVPVVPDATKNLNDLFYDYGGNVEGWVQISPELRDAFKSDFNETACDVRETATR